MTRNIIRQHVFAACSELQLWETDPNAWALVRLRLRDLQWLREQYRAQSR